MDSFMSTIGNLNDPDNWSNDDEGSCKIPANAKDDESGDDEDDDHFSATIHINNHTEWSDGELLSPILLIPGPEGASNMATSSAQVPGVRGATAIVGSSEKTPRVMNYTETEDLLLTKAYVSVSNDPFKGSQQL